MFKELPVNKRSISKRKLVFGVGTNDANYVVKPKIKGERFMCPFYSRWLKMLTRCYDKSLHDKCKAYIGCKVCDDWLTFSVFKEWMKTQNWRGKQLDKDIIIQGNKTYSPSTCVFVSARVNSLLNDGKSNNSGLPRGSYIDSRNGNFIVKIRDGNKKNLCWFVFG